MLHIKTGTQLISKIILSESKIRHFTSNRLWTGEHRECNEMCKSHSLVSLLLQHTKSLLSVFRGRLGVHLFRHSLPWLFIVTFVVPVHSDIFYHLLTYLHAYN